MLSALEEDTMGALLSKLVEVSNQYRDCRTAALAGVPVKPISYGLRGKLK